MKRALFIFSIVHYYREMFPVARFYKSKGFDVHVVIGYSGASADEAARICEDQGFTVHRPPAALRYGDPLARQDGLLRAPDAVPEAKPGFRSFVLHSAGALLSSIRRASRVKRHVKGLVATVAPDLIFGGPFHSCLQIDNGIARAARAGRIPYCCLPVFPYLGERNSVEARFDNLESGTKSPIIRVDYNAANRMLAVVFPEWTRSRDGYRVFMFEPLAMWTARLMGLLERNPWQKPVESYDLVFVESEFTRKMLEDSDYNASKIVVSGKPLLDEVFEKLSDENYRTQLYEELGLKNGEGFLLFNVEPNYYRTSDEYWGYFRSWMESLKDAGRPVVLSLHPLCNPDQYDFVSKEYGHFLARSRKIVELYPYCDGVVSFPCSTNVLIEVFEKPLIIYDVMGHTREGARRADLFRFPGAMYAYDPVELARLVEALASHRIQRGSSARASRRQPACEAIYRAVAERFGV
ncbi:MAG: hypothetical protein ACREKR_00695 [Candidatus Methylomirabilales bacterium]